MSSFARWLGAVGGMALLMATAPAVAVTHVCGTLAADAIWAGGEVYVMDCVVTVPAGRVLRIEPGAVVKLGLRDFFIDGEFIAAGSAAAPVVFTSLQDDAWGGDTNGDGPSVGQPGQWAALTFNPGSRGRLSDALIQYGGGFYFHYSSKALLRSFGGDVALERVTLRGSAAYGLYAESPVHVTESVIGGNGDWGLYYNGLGDGAPLAVVDNVFLGPRPGLLRLEGEHGMVAVRGNRIEGSPSAFAVHGILRDALEWDNDPSFVMIINSDLRIASSGSLRLAPGSIVKLTFGAYNGGELIVEGALEAAGSPELPVVFTSLQDDAWGGDTNGDGPSVGQPGQWSAITFAAGSRGRLSDAVVRYGGGYYFHYGSKALLRGFSDDVVLDGVELSGSGRYGVYAENGPMLLRRCRFTDHAAHAVFNQTPARAVDARRSWWGDPSGPAHPTGNPAGQGGRVSDGVLFFPWAVDEQGTLASQVVLGGPSRVSPGDTVDYAVSYFAGEAIDDAVVKIALPVGAEYVASDGVFWARNAEVFWTLGDLAPLSEGTRSVRVRFPWGLSETTRLARGLLGGSNVDGGGHEFDTAPYYAYARPPAGAAEALDADQIAPLIAARADVAAMVDAARAAGLKLIGGARWARSGRSSLEAVFIGPAETRRVAWDDAGLLALALRPEGATIADARGAMRIDSGDGSVTYEGAWADAAPAAPLAIEPGDHISKGACLNNCIVQGGISLSETGGLAPQAVSPRLATQEVLSRRLWPVLTSKACQTICARFNDCGLCLQALLDDEKGLPEIEDLLFTCSRGCDDPGMRRTARCDYSTRLPPPDPAPILVCEGGFAAHAVPVSVLRCDRTTGAWRREPGLAFECGCRALGPSDQVVCTQQGIGVACSAAPGRVPTTARCGDTYPPRTVAQGYEGRCTAQRFTGYWGTPPAAAGLGGAAAAPGAGGCSEVSTSVRVARDPNEKAGTAGDVVPGDLLTYTVKFENEGGGRAYGVYVLDDLSPALDESTLDLMGAGTFYPATRTILWDIGELAPKGEAGSTGERTFTVRVRADAASGTVIANQAVVYFPSVPEEMATNTVVNTVQAVAATPQTLATGYGAPLAITLRGRDAAGAALTFAVERQPDNGVLTGTPPNLMYLPGENFVGQDRFTFTASNGVSTSLPAAVTVVVQPSPLDRRPPEVVWTYPSDGAVWPAPPTAPLLTDATGPLYGPALAIGFSEPMDAASIDAGSFTVRDQRGGLVEARVSWDATAYRALLAPRVPWERGRYTATVTEAARDASGNSLLAARAWSFRVGTCVGDCNGDGTVSIDELIRGVNIALGKQSVAGCSSFDGDGVVDIADLITAVNAALGGC